MATAIKSEVARRMTCEELAQTAAFKWLAPGLQKWVLAYAQGFIDTESFDHVAATHAAYKCRNDNSARTWGCEIRRKPRVRIVIDEYLNTMKTQAELDLEEIQRQIDAAEPGSTGAQKFWAMKREIQLEMKADADDDPQPPVKPATQVVAPKAEPESRVPPGATPLVDKAGVLRRYRTAAGEYVRLAEVVPDIKS